MKIALASDLHFEFHDDDGAWLVARLPAADVLVCAGDLTTCRAGIPSAARLLCDRYAHVVFVAGNHEHYHSSFHEVRSELQRASDELGNLHVLDNSICEISGIRFVGTTMWFRRLPGIETLQHRLNDFRCIEDASRLLYEENEVACAFLQREVSREDVVVTHHLPSLRSVSPLYVDDPVNCFFVCEMEELIERAQPKLWLHGHSHSSCDYRIGQTRVACNPYGYAGHSVNPQFSELLFDV